MGKGKMENWKGGKGRGKNGKTERGKGRRERGKEGGIPTVVGVVES